MLNKIIGLSILILFVSCKPDGKVDFIINNANIYTLDDNYPWAKSVAVKSGKIVAIADSEKELFAEKGDSTLIIDAGGNFLMPGFIEGHGHFSGLGMSLLNVNLLSAKSWEEVVERVDKKIKEVKPGEWVVGRGWHQEKWDSIPVPNVLGYPYHNNLSAISTENPVVLFHASGHALFANELAMKIVGISTETPNPIGGEIVRNIDGEAIGVFEERAMKPVGQGLQEYIKTLDQQVVKDKWYKAIDLAQQECLKKGITSFQDAGSKFYEIERYTQLAKEGKLDLRLWAMARDSATSLEKNVPSHKVINAGNKFFTCNAIKSEVDGALGAFGAWLLKPYDDKPGFVGQNTTDIYDVKRIADIALNNEMQFCVHAIGDRANRVVLDIYEGMLKDTLNGQAKRWRIEHAQHLNPIDIPRFARFGIIASMQGIHCTSDAPFVEKRLGAERSKLGAYAWRSLLDQGVVIANGTDAPVEDVDPLPSFYASVTRKRIDNGFEFFTEQSMTREEAVYSYTLGNAFAAFEEEFKGSIEIGKVADFVILNKDLINCKDEEILEARVLYTIVDGKVKYANP